MDEKVVVRRLKQVAVEFNLAIDTVVDFLGKQGIALENKPTSKVPDDAYTALLAKFAPDKADKENSNKVLTPTLSSLGAQNNAASRPLAPANQVVGSTATSQNGPSLGNGLSRQSTNGVGRGLGTPPIVEKAPPAKVEAIVPVEPIAPVKDRSAEIALEEATKEKARKDKAESDEQEAQVVKAKASRAKAKAAKDETERLKLENEAKAQQVPEEESPRMGLKVLGSIDLNTTRNKPKKAPAKATATKTTPKATSQDHVPLPADLAERMAALLDKDAVESTTAPTVVNMAMVDEHAPITPAIVEGNDKTGISGVDEATPTQRAPVAPEEEKKGLTVVGKIDLAQFSTTRKKGGGPESAGELAKRRKRKRIGEEGSSSNPAQQAPPPPPEAQAPGQAPGAGGAGRPPFERPGGFNSGSTYGPPRSGYNAPRPGAPGSAPSTGNRPAENKPGMDPARLQENINRTMQRISRSTRPVTRADKKMRRKRKDARRKRDGDMALANGEGATLQVTEFITANELANLMDVPVASVITACMSLGLMVSINQRLDAETISVVASEFGFEIEFREAEMAEPADLEEPDNLEAMITRPPIVTIMGHVDHGKTSLLDYVRSANVVAGEAGGITQHIGAYEVLLPDGRAITFLDTPGHEAFTAMRARGAKVTDIAIIVIAADDSVMPQTREAISHAQAAGVPIVIAINKIDKEGANAARVREQLSELDILVEDWGGKYQCQEISAKKGLGIPELLEKVLLEAELLDLKADPTKRGTGTVVEAALDKGRGIVVTLMVEKGTLRVGDAILAGANFGRVRAMYNERGVRVNEAGPSSPVQVLGFDGAPTSGDKFYVPLDEAIGKEIAAKRKQLIREQGIRTRKHITLAEIGRRLAIGSFKELNLIIKGDVDGSVEALADSLQRLSTEEVQVRVVHKAVGQISESDVLLASASDAIIVGFQVRPSLSARKIAEQEQIDIRMYSVIYDAIDEVKNAMEGLLAPTHEEKIVCNVEVRETFEITKVGTVAGCYVLDGTVTRNTRIRIIRDGVVAHTGGLASLKRFKDDVKEVKFGYECGLMLERYNDIKVGDILEGFEMFEVARKLA